MDRSKAFRDVGAVDDSELTLRQTGDSPTPLNSFIPLSVIQEQPGAEGMSPVCPLPELPLEKSNPKTDSNAFFILNDTANLDPIHKIFSDKKRCELKYLVVECNCGRSVVPSGCMSLACERCAQAVGARRAKSIYNRLMSKNPHKAVIYTVFTIPIERRQLLTDKKKWGRLRKKAWHILQEFGASFSVEASHPISEENPNQFHPHFNFLWVQRDGFNPFLDVEKLRLMWAKVLKISKINVNTRYSRNERQIKHMCNYVARTFPGLHEWTGSIKWYGKYPKRKGGPEKCLCGECLEEFRAVGSIPGYLVKEWYARGYTGDRAPPWDDLKNVTLFERKKNV